MLRRVISHVTVMLVVVALSGCGGEAQLTFSPFTGHSTSTSSLLCIAARRTTVRSERSASDAAWSPTS
jgi:hypothetical protein